MATKITIRIFSLLLFCQLAMPVEACINEYRTRLDGTVVYTDPSSGRITPKIKNRGELSREAEDLMAAYLRSDSVEYLSDYAATLIYLGNYQQAKNIYFNIRVKYPNLYTTASNLGTIYELTGQPDSAYYWIKKSIEINPRSHKGTEWIHLKILEFKLSGSSDYSPSILGLNFGDQAKPENPEDYDLHELTFDIRYQLIERLQFIEAPNKIVGNIYFDLGNAIAINQDAQAALESYLEAKRFGFESKLLDLRIAEMQALSDRAKSYQRWENIEDFVKENPEKVLIALMGSVLLFLGLGFYFLRRRKKRRKEKTKQPKISN